MAARSDPAARKPSWLTQATTALSQLALVFYGFMLLVALVATAGRHPNVAILMAILAAVPTVLGPGFYRLIGGVTLLLAGGLYLTSTPQPVRPGIVAPQKAPAPAVPTPPAIATDKSAR